MRLPRATMNLKLMIALVACIAVYLNVWRVGTETVVERASRDLRHGKTEARRAAAVSLGDAIIQAGASAIPPLAWAVVHDTDAEVRFIAVAALGDYAGLNETAAAALISALKGDSPRIRARAAQSLGTMAALPRVTPALIAALGDPSAEVRAEAAAALGRGAQDWEVVEPALFAARFDADEGVRVAVIVAMDSRSSGPRSTTPSGAERVARYQSMMLAGLIGESPRVRRAAARALGHEPSFGFGDPIALTNAEIDALADPDAEVRAAAATALGIPRDSLVAPTGPSQHALGRALVRLVKALGDADDRVRSAASAVIGPVGGGIGIPSDDEATDLRSALIAALDGPTPEGRSAAVANAGQIGRLVNEGDDFLIRRYAIAARDPDARVRFAAIAARTDELTMPEFRKSRAIRNLRYLMRLPSIAASRDWGTSRELSHAMGVAREYLSDLKSLDRGTIVDLEKLLRSLLADPDPDVRRLAYTSLWRVDALRGGDASRRRALLGEMKAQIEALGSDSSKLREIAAWSLYWVPRADAPAAMAALKLRAADADSRVRDRVAASLKQQLYYQSIRPRQPWPEPRWEPWGGR